MNDIRNKSNTQETSVNKITDDTGREFSMVKAPELIERLESGELLDLLHKCEDDQAREDSDLLAVDASYPDEVMAFFSDLSKKFNTTPEALIELLVILSADRTNQTH